MEKEDVIDLRLLFRAAMSKLWLAIAVSVVVATATFIATKMFVTPMYRTSFSLYVNNSAENAKQTLSSSDISASRSLASTYSEIIVSRSVLMNAAEELGLDKTYAELCDQVNAEKSETTELISVSVEAESPKEALELAEAIKVQAEKQISRIVIGSSMSVVDDPVLPKHQASPNSKKNAIVGAVIGFFAVMGFAVIGELIDDRVKDEQTLEERLGFSVMGTIPNVYQAEKASELYYGGYGEKKEEKNEK